MIRRTFLAAVAFAAASLFLTATPTLSAQDGTRLLRFPHIHGDRVVFTYAGDLYTASLDGGQATRLTSHEGLEIFAKFSPDGRWIAFSGEYAGTRQVYVIPSSGGEPRQLTYYPDVGAMPPRGGYDHLVLDWTPDGSKILVRANRTPFGERVGRYYLVDPFNGGLEVPLEIPEGASGATYDPTGTQLAYNIKSREWRHWKRYRGGRQQDVWLYDLEASSSRRITEFTGTDNFPLWVDDAIYFTSDRGPEQKLNLWRYDLDTGAMGQVTHHDTFDVLWPGRGRGGIVYQSGGWIWHLDPATDETRRLAITVTGDRPHTLPYWTGVADRIESFDLSPSGSRALFGARGEIFTVPAEHGNTRNLSGTPGERERSVAWSPDGRWIAYLSDASGAYELYVRPAGGGPARQLTADGDSWIYEPRWSPDSEWIAWSDQRNRIRAVAVATGTVREVARSETDRLNDFSWAPDSRWIAFSMNGPDGMSSVRLYSFDRDRATQVTSDMTDEREPVFDPGGRYLYFVSDRDFDYGDRGFDARIFAATLRADAPHPFPPRSDEEPAGGGTPEDARQPAAAPSSDAPLEIDLDGLGDRVVALPGVEPGSYSDLRATADGLLYVSDGTLHLYSLAERKPETVIDGIRGYAVTPDRSKLLYAAGDDYGIVDVRPGQSTGDGLDLSELELRIDPRVEWAQIFHDAWLITRDWFYDPGMHGVDWRAMYEKYRPLVDHVAHRADLDFLLAELVAELNVGHTYVNSPPGLPGPDRVPVGLLGAELEPDGDRYRIANIFPGENWHEEFRSPLTEPGIGVEEGDYLIAIDGEPVTTADNPYGFLVNKADRIVTVTVSDRPDGRDARSYDVRPVESEAGLRYQEWVAENAALVDSLSDGRIGYTHLPNTAVPGHRELYEGFPPLHRKDALIIDDRYNGGGFIPEEMALMLDRPLLNYWARRNLELYSQPGVVHTGPKAVLINGQASSGGDAFPYYFQQLGLGPLIGERTWGGLVGISGNPGFVDGGSINVPAFAFVDTDGEWAVEGVGVDPDIEVLDRPEEIAAGREPIIERAVQYLLQELEKPQYRRPEKPEGPDRGHP
ncbi:MAG: S41 family peptidase [Gemmatimonadota bacterium]